MFFFFFSPLQFLINLVDFNQWFPCVNRKKSLQGIKRKLNSDAEEDSEVEDPGLQDGQKAAVESDDEAEYYRQAVGEEPDEGELKEYKCLKQLYIQLDFVVIS